LQPSSRKQRRIFRLHALATWRCKSIMNAGKSAKTI
jgi:hypothetical protein